MAGRRLLIAHGYRLPSQMILHLLLSSLRANEQGSIEPLYAITIFISGHVD